MADEYEEFTPQDEAEKLAEREEEEASIIYDEDALNLVEAFRQTDEGKRYLKKISNKVDSDYETDWESSSAYRDRNAADWKLFTGDLPPKDYPYEDSANPNLPIYLENMTRLCFRITGELFGDWTKVFGVVPVGPDDEAVAEILSKHGNWQIAEQIPSFKREIGFRGVLGFMGFGDVVCHSYYDEETRLNKHEILTCDNFVTPYQHISTEPDFSDCPHYTKVLRLYRHQLEAKKDLWYDVEKVLEKARPSWDDDPEAPLAQAAGETLGKTPEDGQSDKDLGGESVPYTILWYEGWLRLPNQTKDRWCQVIQDKTTKCILRLTIHERANWQDRERYNAQIRERDEHLQAMAQHGQMMMQYEQMGAMAQEAQGRVDQTRGEVADALQAGQMDGQNAVALAGQVDAMAPPPLPPPPPPPMPPEWLASMPMEEHATAEPEPIRREPVYLFAHEVCIEPMTSNLGISYGRVQADFQRGANVALSQVTDSATQANATSYISWGLEFEDGQLNLSPGKVNKVTGAIGTNIKDHFMPLQTGQASPQLFEIMKLCLEESQNSIQSPGVLSGESGKSGETKGGIMSRIEQATKQLSVLTSKYADFVQRILVNNAYLNSIFLPEDEMAFVLNTETVQYEELKLGRQLYERNYRVQLKSDRRFVTNVERIQENDELVQMWLSVPALTINPVFGYHALKNALMARGKPDFVRYLGSPPQLPIDPMTGKPVTFLGMPPPPPPAGAPGPGGPPKGPPPPGQPNGAPQPEQLQ